MPEQRIPPVWKRSRAAEAADRKRTLSRNKYNSKCIAPIGINSLGDDVVTLNSDFLNFEKLFMVAESVVTDKTIEINSSQPTSGLAVGAGAQNNPHTSDVKNMSCSEIHRTHIDESPEKVQACGPKSDLPVGGRTHKRKRHTMESKRRVLVAGEAGEVKLDTQLASVATAARQGWGSEAATTTTLPPCTTPCHLVILAPQPTNMSPSQGSHDNERKLWGPHRIQLSQKRQGPR